jgi:hypothetical protein
MDLRCTGLVPKKLQLFAHYHFVGSTFSDVQQAKIIVSCRGI